MLLKAMISQTNNPLSNPLWLQTLIRQSKTLVTQIQLTWLTLIQMNPLRLLSSKLQTLMQEPIQIQREAFQQMLISQPTASKRLKERDAATSSNS